MKKVIFAVCLSVVSLSSAQSQACGPQDLIAGIKAFLAERTVTPVAGSVNMVIEDAVNDTSAWFTFREDRQGTFGISSEYYGGRVTLNPNTCAVAVIFQTSYLGFNVQ